MRRAWLRLAAAAIATLFVAGAWGLEVISSPGRPPAAMVLGVLEADPAWLAADTRAGFRLAVLNLDWSRWDPSPGVTDGSYAAGEAASVARYRAAGWQVGIDPGLQSPPAWVLQLPGGTLADQYGDRSPTANFEFSAGVRRAGAAYLASVVSSLGPVQYYRVGLSENGEALYPSVVRDGWWAYSVQAQGGAPGLPAGVTAAPLPGWVPGSPDWNGRPVGQAAATVWYRWYFGAMVNALDWEIKTYRSAGFRGAIELVLPGTGTTPQAYAYRLAHDLAPAPDLDSFATMNTGAVWWKLLATLPRFRGETVDISSVGDMSGTPRGNACRQADDRVDYMTDPAVQGWSDARWLTYLAHRHGLAVVGENPGETPPSDVPLVLALARSCHMVALQWAFDFELHDSNRYASAADLARAIRRYG